MDRNFIVEVWFHETVKEEPPFGINYSADFIPYGSDDPLGIEFVNLTRAPFGEHILSKVKLIHDDIDYSLLSANKHFSIRKEGKILGEGLVMCNYAATNISLSHDEALILSDVLYRISQDETLFPDIAERQALWCIEAQLDVVLVEPFMPDYTRLVNEAKDRIRYRDE